MLKQNQICSDLKIVIIYTGRLIYQDTASYRGRSCSILSQKRHCASPHRLHGCSWASLLPSLILKSFTCPGRPPTSVHRRGLAREPSDIVDAKRRWLPFRLVFVFVFLISLWKWRHQNALAGFFLSVRAMNSLCFFFMFACNSDLSIIRHITFMMDKKFKKSIIWTHDDKSTDLWHFTFLPAFLASQIHSPGHFWGHSPFGNKSNQVLWNNYNFQTIFYTSFQNSKKASYFFP